MSQREGDLPAEEVTTTPDVSIVRNVFTSHLVSPSTNVFRWNAKERVMGVCIAGEPSGMLVLAGIRSLSSGRLCVGEVYGATIRWLGHSDPALGKTNSGNGLCREDLVRWVAWRKVVDDRLIVTEGS